MLTLHRLIATMLLLVSPARIVAALPAVLPATAQAESSVTAPYNIQLTTGSATGITSPTASVPNFDTEVLQPLRAAQAKAQAEAQARMTAEAAAKAAEQAKLAAASSDAGDQPTDMEDGWYKLRLCESGNRYDRNSGNGYFGAYQYSIATWNNYGGFARPDLAPADVQDAKAKADYARRGASPWPSCGRYLQ
jgi:hypothetical protein